jgi:hypothetical protein
MLHIVGLLIGIWGLKLVLQMSNSIKPQKEREKEIFGTLDSAYLSLIEDDAMSFGAQETLNTHGTPLPYPQIPPHPSLQ